MTPAPLCDVAVSIDHTTVTIIQKTGERTTLATVRLSVGGFYVSAELDADGTLTLPRGIDMPHALRARAEGEAQRCCIEALQARWHA